MPTPDAMRMAAINNMRPLAAPVKGMVPVVGCCEGRLVSVVAVLGRVVGVRSDVAGVLVTVVAVVAGVVDGVGC